ncbi:putative HTH-type transcriptional regulator YybR [compost metagenome]
MPKRRPYDHAPGCSVEAALNLINGRWKGVILYHLLDGVQRFNELHRHLPGCSARLMVKQLRELESDGFIHREVYAEVPPRVEYSLTEEGRSIEPLLMQLRDWGDGWLLRRGMSTYSEMDEKRRQDAQKIKSDPAGLY